MAAGIRASTAPALPAPTTRRVLAPALARVWAVLIAPTLAYFAGFCLLTYPLIWSFGSALFADDGDGLQNYWNLWWVDTALTRLHQSPWFTPLLHYPGGVSLVGQTLNPFNGFAGVVLLRWLSLAETYNAIVIFSFVMGGLTTFWLARACGGAWWSSLIAGGIFTFANYHFAHAQGHLQLVSLEWLPLFLLCWLCLLERPTLWRALAAAVVLLLVQLCDYYYYFYCVLAGALLFGWQIWQATDWRAWFRQQSRLVALGIFGLVALVLTSPLPAALYLLNRRDPLSGEHVPTQYSLELASLLIPGGHWRFARLTEWYWARLPGNIHESSVSLGLAMLILLIATWRLRRALGGAALSYWYGTLVVFILLALGPALVIGDAELHFTHGLTPYGLLERIFPPLRLSGMPIRMVVMVNLCAAVICALGLPLLWRGGARRRVLVVALLALMVVEFLPAPLPETHLALPAYYAVLQQRPDHFAVIDLATDQYHALAYQTMHGRPLASGYVSRLPASVET
ncbi:MAG TPA: hypothetical protein VID72_13705, partial [Ktedonobacterales bacterium]